jgi:rhodanese-related sulfurtransferase
VSLPTISPLQLHELQKAGRPVELIDVRTPAEFHEAHCEGARLVPLDRLDARAVLAARAHSAGPLYVTCRSGSRARQACERLLAAGAAEVVCVEGGILAWERAGLPVKRGRKSLALDRQVRIATGLLVVLAAVLALVIHASFATVDLFAGLGMVYAGVTERCGMVMVLARMPWNQRGSEQRGACS